MYSLYFSASSLHARLLNGCISQEASVGFNWLPSLHGQAHLQAHWNKNQRHLKNNLSPSTFWSNMAPRSPLNTLLYPAVNTRMPPLVTVKYDSLEVDTVTCRASLQSCNAGRHEQLLLHTAAAEESSSRKERGLLYRVHIHALCTFTNIQTWKKRGLKGREEEGIEWKIPSRLLVIYSTHAFLHLTHTHTLL